MNQFAAAPTPLPEGGHIYVSDVSNKIQQAKGDLKDAAIKALEGRGFKVTLAPELSATDSILNYNSVEARLRNLRTGLDDESVDFILAVMGGSTVKYLLANNPEVLDTFRRRRLPFGGFSDNAALCNALAQKELVSFYGPSLVNFADVFGDYTYTAWEDMVRRGHHVVRLPEFYNDAPADAFGLRLPPQMQFPAWEVIQSGEAQGMAVVGNIFAYSMLYDCYQPDLEGNIMFVESGGQDMWDAVSLTDTAIHRYGKPAAIVFGTLTTKMAPDRDKFIEAIRQMPYLPKNIPVIIGAPFGHVAPRITIPIGGWAKLRADSDSSIDLELFTTRE